jgi:hypothetical protein
VTRSALVTFAIVVLALLGLTARVDAYPQFQLDEATCTGCHLSPAGGNLLNENGLVAAESMSQLGHAPGFFYDKVPTPSWLTLGGDVRGAAGFQATPEKVLAAFPMQAELYGAATSGNLSVHATVGARPSQFGNRAATSVWSREHYVMWQQAAGSGTGAFVRAGRFMPVFGLRLAEHPTYIRRHGGTPLFAETYGVHAAYIDPKWEAHVTGFVEDPLIDPVDHASGAAAYAEVRLSETLTLGGEGMYQQTADDKKVRGGVIGKLKIPDARILVQGEVQFVNGFIDRTSTNPDGGAPHQLVGYVMGSMWLGAFLLLDVGLGHYDQNIRIRDLDRDCIDVNLHYFLTSHLELVLNARYEVIGFGQGGPSSGYALGQLHYRL